jgi:hypothetical protein
MSNEREIAWAGGLFEGEGCFTVSKSYYGTIEYRTPIATIGMVETEPIERFLGAVEMGSINGPYRRHRANHRDVWRWNLRGPDAVADLVALLEPYLTDRRVARGLEVVRLATTPMVAKQERLVV